MGSGNKPRGSVKSGPTPIARNTSTGPACGVEPVGWFGSDIPESAVEVKDVPAPGASRADC